MSFSLLHDELHLYPSAPTLAAVWATCVVAHAALRLLWLSVTMPRKDKAGELKGQSSSLWTRYWPWALCDDGATPRWCWLSMRAGLHHSALWKTMARRSAYATLVVAVAIVGVNSTMLYFRTGSWVQQPYGWYSLQATGSRVFSANVALPSKILESCLAPAKVAPVDETLLTMDTVVSFTTPKAPIVVYVVPYGSSGVVEISRAQATATNGSYDSLSHAALRATEPTHRDYTRIVPVDELTMFPYVWHSMLGAGFSNKINAESPWERRVDEAQVTYKLVRNQVELQHLEPASNVFAIVQGMPSALQLADQLSVGSKLGYIALSKEDCNNPHGERYASHPVIRFGLIPYGDCSIVDNHRFSVIPLGPSFEHGFPIDTHLTSLPSVAERTHLLNLMVSWTVEKPTRIQAMIAALNVCGSSLANGRGCVVEHNDLAFKVLQKIDSALGLDLRWALSSAPDAYVENLKQSVFTLCPFGKNPEQYRIWEALAAGSIPIIEDLPLRSASDNTSFAPGAFFHPSYPTSWKCRPDADVHSFLKRKDAPVVFVTDWKRDLPRVIRYYTIEHPEELEALQARAKQWYRAMSEHLQADLVAKSLRHFS